jgi:hypothetical protein
VEWWNDGDGFVTTLQLCEPRTVRVVLLIVSIGDGIVSRKEADGIASRKSPPDKNRVIPRWP